MSEDQAQHQLFCVPVRGAGCGVALRLFRNRDGSRCAAAFTSQERLIAVLGAGQRWIPLAEAALRGLTRPLGIEDLVVDPSMVAAPVLPTPATVDATPTAAAQPARSGQAGRPGRLGQAVQLSQPVQSGRKTPAGRQTKAPAAVGSRGPSH